MRKKASGFYADSLEMLLDTMCNVLGGIIFITLTLAVLVRNSASPQAYAQQTAEMTNALAAVAVSNAVLEAELAQTIEQLQAPHPEVPTNHIRLPQTGSTARDEWEVIVRHGQLFPLQIMSPESAGKITRNTRSIDWKTVQRGVESATPRAGQGDEPETGVLKMIQAFRRTSKTNFYLSFRVYADSFEAFNRAEATAASLGFQYGWEPLQNQTLLLLQVNGRRDRVPPQN